MVVLALPTHVLPFLLPGKLNRNVWLLAGLINETVHAGWVQNLKESLKNIISSEEKKT